jgi:tetratricopeptide (TPR) repeat protein
MKHGKAIGRIALPLLLFALGPHDVPAAVPAAGAPQSAEEFRAGTAEEFRACTTEESRAGTARAAQIDRLIEALGDGNYFVRQQAESDLQKFGFEALDALTAATEHDDLEIATRANRLLHVIRSDWTTAGEPPQVSRLLSDYDALEIGSREGRISSLIDLADNQGMAAVCRVIRYERSLPLAKTAALQLMESREKDEGKSDLAAGLKKGLGACRREPAQWVLGWLQARRDRNSLAGFWTRLAGEEEELLFRRPRDTSAAIVASLLRFQIAALRKIDRGGDAARSVETLITLHRSNPDELARLLNWLIAERDWPGTRVVETRCEATIAESADLLYLLAEAQVRRGDAAAAKQSAGRALGIRPGSDPRSLALHLQEGFGLQERGQSEWAVQEWQHVMQTAPPRSPGGLLAAHLLSELYHDREDDLRAAETLGRIAEPWAAASDPTSLPGLDGTALATLGALRARKEYFDACRWKAQGDFARQRAALDRALGAQGYDIEVLIDCYKLPGSTKEYRAKICRLIEKQVCELREQAADIGPKRAAAQPCNELAWLVANTQGDLAEALRFSQRSLELAGEQGSYLDTLAHVYFAKGDYASAVKNQSRAADLLPHNRAVQKQLILFQRKAKEMGIPVEKSEKAYKAADPRGKSPWEDNPAASEDDDPFGN